MIFIRARCAEIAAIGVSISADFADWIATRVLASIEPSWAVCDFLSAFAVSDALRLLPAARFGIVLA